MSEVLPVGGVGNSPIHTHTHTLKLDPGTQLDLRGQSVKGRPDQIRSDQGWEIRYQGWEKILVRTILSKDVNKA